MFLGVFAPAEIYFILNSKKKSIPYNWLNISKFVIISALVLLNFIEIIITYNSLLVQEVDFYLPIIKLITFVSIKAYTI